MARPDLAYIADYQAHRASRFPAMLERWLAFFTLYFVLFFCTGAVIALVVANGDTAIKEEDFAFIRLMNIPLVVIVPIAVLTRARDVSQELIRNPALLALIMLATISVAWSVNPEVTIRRLLFLWTTTLFAFWVAVRFTPEEVVKHCTYYMLAALGGSIAMGAAVPSLGFMAEGQFRGIFLHKNGFGGTFQLGWIFFLLAWRFKQLPGWLMIGALALTFVGLILADSATALGISVLLTVGFFCLGWVRLPPAVGGLLVATGIAGAAMAALVLILEPTVLFTLLGRDADLTGRVPLWQFLLGMIERRPWTGYGYAAFFSMPEYTQHLFDALTWGIPHAHSGYIESLVGLGVMGLVFALVLIVVTVVRGFRLLRQGELLLANLVLLHIGAVITRNFSESDMMQHQSLIWIVWVYAAAAGGRALASAKTGSAGRLHDEQYGDYYDPVLPPSIGYGPTAVSGSMRPRLASRGEADGQGHFGRPAA